MTRSTWLSVVLICSGCAAATPKVATGPDPAEGQSLEAFAREMFAHLDQGDFAFLKQTACPNAMMFDTDEHGAPIAARGKAEVNAALDGFAKVLAGGATFQTNLQQVDCRAYGGRGYCAIDFDQTITMGEQTMTMKLRGTLIAKQYKDRWIWDLWHASSREAAPGPM